MARACDTLHDIISPFIQGRDEPRERSFVLAADDRVCLMSEEKLRIESRIQSVKGDVARGIHRSHSPRRAHSKAEGRMHRHRNSDKPCPPDALFVAAFDGQVQGLGLKSRALQECQGHGQAHRLVPQFVAGEQQNRSRFSQIQSIHS